MPRTIFTPLISVLLLAACLLGSLPAAAQLKMPVGSGNIYFKTGLGSLQISQFNKQGYSDANLDYKVRVPLLVIGFEAARFKNLALGGVIGYGTFHSEQPLPGSKTNEQYTGDIKIYNVFLTLKYFVPVTFGKIVPYLHTDLLGLTAYSERRYLSVNGKETYLIDPSIGLSSYISLLAGANYQLSDRFSALAELGLGYSFHAYPTLNVGINYHLEQ